MREFAERHEYLAAGKPVVSTRLVMRDWIECPITLRRGLTGAKPEKVCHWAFEVVGAHIPTVGRPDRWIKVETQEGLVARLKEATLPTIVCGDFNSPRGEAADGEIVPFATARGGRALAAERALVGRTNSAGMVDVFRAVHGYERDAASWYWKNRGRTGGFRLDHIFASKEVRVSRCDYDHVCRDIGLSDHSAIYADFELECANSGMPDSTTASAFSSEAP